MSQTPSTVGASSSRKGLPGWFLAIGGIILGLALGYMIGNAGGAKVPLEAMGQKVEVAAKYKEQAQTIARDSKALQDRAATLEGDIRKLQQQLRESIPLAAIPTEFRRPDVNGTVEQLRAAAGAGGGASTGAGGDIGFLVADLAASIRVSPIDTTKPPADDAQKQRLVQLARLFTWLGVVPGGANVTQADVNKVVMSIQTQAKLTPDGKLGPRTWTAIEAMVKTRRAKP